MMNKKKNISEDYIDLRKRAEKKLQSASTSNKNIIPLETEHELDVYKAELEIQNEELRSTQLKLAQTVENYTELFEFAPVGYFILDINGNIIKPNTTGNKLMGYHSVELIGKPFSNLMSSGNEQDQFYRHRMKVIDTEKLHQLESVIKRKDESLLPVLITSTIIKNNHKEFKHFIMMVNDISIRKNAEKALKESYLSIRQLTDHLQVVKDEERSYIAQEIHDELGQEITAAIMEISMLDKKIDKDNKEAKNKIPGLLKLLRNIMKAVHHILAGLHPSVLDNLGLEAAIEVLLKEFENRSGIKTRLLIPKHALHINEALKIALFRIFQESLTNVARHSMATVVEVSIKKTDDNIMLIIQDNGKGFDEKNIDDNATFGILGMKVRTESLGGEFIIDSEPGKGTTVKIIASLK